MIKVRFIFINYHSDEQKESNTARQRFAEQPNKQPDTTGMLN